MGGVRLRTKFLVAMLLTSAGLTAVTLFIVQHAIASRAREGIVSDLHNSVENFRNVQLERETTLRASAQLLANLPILKALMTSGHAPTIQDASEELFRLSGRDLLALVDPSGQLVGFHAGPDGVRREAIQKMLAAQTLSASSFEWWFADGHLYEVYLEPIYFGPSSSNTLLGIVAVGYEVTASVARQVSKVAAGEVAVLYGPHLVVTTLRGTQLLDFQQRLTGKIGSDSPENFSLDGEKFVGTSIGLNPDDAIPATMVVMKSYDNAIAFLQRLQKLLLIVGVCAVFAGSVLVYFMSRTFTRPLERLAIGVSALGTGDFAFPLLPGGGGEVVQLTKAFTRMRNNLRETQQSLIESERLATIGRMAGSISHDLRHPLTAVLANAEFLAEAELTDSQREELYQEIRIAVNRLTDLVDSLLELSRPTHSLSLTDVSLTVCIDRVIALIRTHPEFQRVSIAVDAPPECIAQLDPKKMERVFHNLLLNACQAVQAKNGQVAVSVAEGTGKVSIRISDNGDGVHPTIKTKLFQPFISMGKENGTGLGLTIAQKIVQDHGGSLELETSSAGCTVMLIILPRTNQSEQDRFSQTSSINRGIA